jgi:hypothetical protein
MSINNKLKKFEQNIFDNIMFTILTTICCEDYLHHYGIHRPKPIKNWEKFKKQIDNQTVKPGLYPESFGGEVAHYHGVRKEDDGTLTIANGYPSFSGLNKKYAKGLNVQEDHSHGFCQVYALMYYFRAEHFLKTGRDNNDIDSYYKNIFIGLKWLNMFIATHNWVFSQKDIENLFIDEKYNIDIQHKYIQKFLGEKFYLKKHITLHTLLKIVSKKKNIKFVDKWFFNYIVI